MYIYINILLKCIYYKIINCKYNEFKKLQIIYHSLKNIHFPYLLHVKPQTARKRAKLRAMRG